MTIENTDVVDSMGIDNRTGRVHLSICDHLEWTAESDEEHLVLLQEKLNRYLEFVESGEYLDVMPDAKGLGVQIDLISLFECSEEGSKFLEYASKALLDVGIELRFVHSPLSGDLH